MAKFFIILAFVALAAFVSGLEVGGSVNVNTGGLTDPNTVTGGLTNVLGGVGSVVGSVTGGLTGVLTPVTSLLAATLAPLTGFLRTIFLGSFKFFACLLQNVGRLVAYLLRSVLAMLASIPGMFQSVFNAFKKCLQDSFYPTTTTTAAPTTN